MLSDDDALLTVTDADPLTLGFVVAVAVYEPVNEALTDPDKLKLPLELVLADREPLPDQLTLLLRDALRDAVAY